MHRSEYEHLRNLIIKEHDEKLKALDLVWSIARNVSPAEQTPTTPTPKVFVTHHFKQKSSVADTILQAAQKFESDFSTSDLMEAIAELNGEPMNGNSFYSSFRGLKDKGYFESTADSSGRKPAKYRYIEQPGTLVIGSENQVSKQ